MAIAIVALCLTVLAQQTAAVEYSCGNHRGRNGKMNPCTAENIAENGGNLLYPHRKKTKYVECFKSGGKQKYHCRVGDCEHDEFVPELQGCARYKYAAACLPFVYDGENEQCFITLLSKTATKVQVSTASESRSITLPAGILQRVDSELNPTEGLEKKAIAITSVVQLHVVVNKGPTWYGDVYQTPSLKEDSNSFLTTAYISNDNPCSSVAYKEFYVVASYHKDTDVTITQQNGTRFELKLSEHETFAQKTLSSTDHLASGTRIQSSKPVSVISGNLCINNRIIGSFGAYASTMPPLASLRKRYFLPKIVSSRDPPAGFSVSVVATKDNTIVEIEDNVQYLGDGQTAIFEYPYQARGLVVNCSQVCLVVQYSKTWWDEYGPFMLQGLPKDQFYTSAYFSGLEEFHPTRLSLVMHGKEPGNDLYLDGASLGYLNWTAIDGFASAELSISSGNHELESVNGRPFGAFAYGHAEFDRGGGYSVLA